MWQLIDVIENSSFAIWVRETPSVLTYPTVLAAHALGMAFLVGFSGMIALRILGFASDLPLEPMKRFYRLINVGLWVNVISGIVLLILSATTFLRDPIFWIKLVAIAAAVLCVRLIRANIFGSRDVEAKAPSPEGRFLATTLLVFWGIAILAGRLTAYSFVPIGWQTIVAVVVAAILVTLTIRIGSRALASEKPARHANVRTGTGY